MRNAHNKLISFYRSIKKPDPNYINQEINNIKVKTINQLWLQYVSQLSAYATRNVIVYYSTFLQGNIMSNNPELMINDNDMNGFMNTVSGLDRSKGVDLVNPLLFLALHNIYL